MNNRHISPLGQRYASEKMQRIFSNSKEFCTWKRLWITSAESEKELGLVITREQIDELKAHAEDINYDAAREREKIVRHNVMSYVYAYGRQCLNVEGIIRLDVTPCFVGDNTDLIVMYETLELVEKKLVNVLTELKKFALDYRDLPVLAFTHFQPAQPVTLGKRTTIWTQDLLLGYEELCFLLENKKLRDYKGATGIQASFMELLDNDEARVKQLDQMIAHRMSYEKSFAVSIQTYSREVNSRILNTLSSIAQSVHKFSNDIRLPQNLKEVEEPLEKRQIGSSAMAYKRNPTRSEWMASLANYVIADTLNPAITTATQWFERTLDDPTNKRISIPEAFLAADDILGLYLNITDGLVVYPEVIESRLMKELLLMVTEMILMDAVKAGGDRREPHERIRVHSMAVGRVVKEEGPEDDLLRRIAEDAMFPMGMEQLKAIMSPISSVGRAPSQTVGFFEECIDPVLETGKEALGLHAEINV